MIPEKSLRLLMSSEKNKKSKPILLWINGALIFVFYNKGNHPLHHTPEITGIIFSLQEIPVWNYDPFLPSSVNCSPKVSSLILGGDWLFSKQKHRTLNFLPISTLPSCTPDALTHNPEGYDELHTIPWRWGNSDGSTSKVKSHKLPSINIPHLILSYKKD